LKYIIAEVDGGLTKVLKEADSLHELSRMDIAPGIFPAIFVSRDDIYRALYDEIYEEEGDEECEEERYCDVSKITDQEMMDICVNLQDVYVEYGSYWDDLESVCEDLQE